MLSLCLSMILGGFTRICVNIHDPALAASFRDVARLKRTEQGRVALGVTPRLPQIRACRLPAPASSSHEVATSAIRRRYVDMDQVSMYLGCFPSTVPEMRPLPLTGSLGSVSPIRRYYGVLRLPATRFATLRFLRWAIPAWRPWFVPIGSGRGAVDHPGVVHPVLPPAVGSGNGRVSQVPGGTLMIIRHTPPTPA